MDFSSDIAPFWYQSMGIRCNVLLYITVYIYSVHEHMYNVINEILITCGDPRLIISFQWDSRDMQIPFLAISYQQLFPLT